MLCMIHFAILSRPITNLISKNVYISCLRCKTKCFRSNNNLCVSTNEVREMRKHITVVVLMKSFFASNSKKLIYERWFEDKMCQHPCLHLYTILCFSFFFVRWTELIEGVHHHFIANSDTIEKWLSVSNGYFFSFFIVSSVIHSVYCISLSEEHHYQK